MLTIREMERANSYGRMVHTTKDSGRMVELTDMENSSTQMVIITKEDGKMTKHTATASSYTKMAQSTSATGRMILSMAKAKRCRLTDLTLKASTKKVKSTVEESSAGTTVRSMTVVGSIAKWKDQAYTLGQMVEVIKVSGRRVTWMESASAL